MRYKCSVFAATIAFHAFFAFAQNGPCKEQFIRDQSAQSGPAAKTDDYYLFNPMLEKPVIGTEERDKANKALDPVMAKRKNQKNEPAKVERIVTAPSGDMAYEYGTFDFTYDDSDTGKHVERQVAFLWVWRADGGSCKLAAAMLQREGER